MAFVAIKSCRIKMKAAVTDGGNRLHSSTQKRTIIETLVSTQTWSYQPLHIHLVVNTYCRESEGFQLNTLK